LRKNRGIHIRITEEQYVTIKNLDGNITKIFELGYEKFTEQSVEILQKRSEQHYDLYIQCIHKIEEFNKNVITRVHKLEELRKQYLEHDRSIDNPSLQDLSWMKSRIRKIDGATSTNFLKYCISKKDVNEKQ